MSEENKHDILEAKLEILDRWLFDVCDYLEYYPMPVKDKEEIVDRLSKINARLAELEKKLNDQYDILKDLGFPMINKSEALERVEAIEDWMKTMERHKARLFKLESVLTQLLGTIEFKWMETQFDYITAIQNLKTMMGAGGNRLPIPQDLHGFNSSQEAIDSEPTTDATPIGLESSYEAMIKKELIEEFVLDMQNVTTVEPFTLKELIKKWKKRLEELEK